MFQQGDQVVHRIHGAGTVVAILQPDSAPKECEYYELDLVALDTRLMVPVEGAEGILRPVSSPSVVEEALKAVPEPVSGSADEGKEWQRQQQRLRDRLRTGRALAAAEVIHSLVARRQKKRLNFSDRRTLQRAITFLASELALARGIPLEQAECQIERWAMA